MKRLSLALISVLLLGATLSRSDVTELLKMDILAEKEALVRGSMTFAPGEASKFWPLYREYAREMDKIWGQRFELVSRYSDNFPNPGGDLADELVTRTFALDEQQLKLQRKYYRKIKSATSEITAARFVQVDRRVDNLIELSLSQRIPLFK